MGSYIIAIKWSAKCTLRAGGLGYLTYTNTQQRSAVTYHTHVNTMVEYEK